MSKIRNVFIAVLFTLALSSFASADETLTITTYYPSPYGSYNQLTTTGNAYLATTSGNVGIGTTAPGNKLHVVGGIRVTTLAAASATTVCRDGSSDLSTCSSSRKFKEGIEYLKPAEEQGILQNIKDTNIARFRMKTENSNVRHIGIIAEESPRPLQFIDEHNNQNIDLLSAQLGYTWAAIKALDRQIGGLQNENKQLKAKINLLEAKLKRK